jgi:hypothetical protein
MVTTDSMVSLLNAGLDYGQKKLSVLEQNAKAWIGDAKTQLQEALADLKNKKQKELGKVKAEAAKVAAKGSEDTASSSVAFNWVGYQLQHGGVVTNTVIRKPSSSDGMYMAHTLLHIWIFSRCMLCLCPQANEDHHQTRPISCLPACRTTSPENSRQPRTSSRTSATTCKTSPKPSRGTT